MESRPVKLHQTQIHLAKMRLKRPWNAIVLSRVKTIVYKRPPPLILHHTVVGQDEITWDRNRIADEVRINLLPLNDEYLVTRSSADLNLYMLGGADPHICWPGIISLGRFSREAPVGIIVPNGKWALSNWEWIFVFSWPFIWMAFFLSLGKWIIAIIITSNE